MQRTKNVFMEFLIKNLHETVLKVRLNFIVCLIMVFELLKFN